jgi:hypothetical protein
MLQQLVAAGRLVCGAADSQKRMRTSDLCGPVKPADEQTKRHGL